MNNYTKSFSKQFIKKILSQMENYFFKIYENDDKFDIGFFCYIKYKNETIPVIIINNYKINNDIINVSINNDNKITIELGNTRYNDKEYNISILEIKLNNNYKFQFFDIDDDIYLEDSIMYYYKKPIYIIQYIKDKETLISYDIVNDINKKHIRFSNHLTKKNDLSLLFNFDNNKLIGIHKSDFKYSNKGLFIKFIIDKFIQNFKHKYNYNNNEINMIVNIEKNDINKDIYFLDNYKETISKKEHLDEINELNTKLFINKKEYSYKKYFRFEKEGRYNIKIKFKKKLKDCSYMFAKCENIINIDLTNFKSENIENMEYMFYYCKNLKNINLLSLKTENVKNMSYMFYGCNNIKNLDIYSFENKNNIDMSNIIENFEKINYSNFSFFKKIKNEYKICFVGESRVGAKTSLIKRIVNNKFYPDILSTYPGSYSSYVFELNKDKKIKLHLFDAGGAKNLRAFANLYMKDSHSIVMGFDVTSKDSFDEIKEYWYPTVREILENNLIYLIGNKIDENPAFDLEEAKNFALENHLRYFEISCKTAKGIKEFLDDLKREIVKI